jgi:hypothetical protein
MGQPPLNCQNDDTPHRFPSQALTEPAWNEQPCLCGNTKVWVMPGMEFKGLRCHLCPPEPTKPTLRLVQT